MPRPAVAFVVVLVGCASASPAEVPTVELPGAATVSAAPATGEGEMVRVPTGALRTRSPEGASEARIATFEIDLTEVTVSAYQRCVDAGRCAPAGSLVEGPTVSVEQRERMSQFCIGNRGDRADHPVNCVDHAQATAYCAFAGKRLPTGEQWEYAARGSDGRAFPWGDEPPDPELLNACDLQCARGFRERGLELAPMLSGTDGFETTAPVRSFPDGRSAFGLFDMAGNVSEWTDSSCAAGESSGCSPGQHELRGGGWFDTDPRRVRATSREWAAPESRSFALGFRCAR